MFFDDIVKIMPDMEYDLSGNSNFSFHEGADISDLFLL